MLRLLAAWIVVGVVGMAPAWAAPVPTDKSPASMDPRLTKTADFGGIDDNKATLLDALDCLRQVYGVNFDVNETAFKADGLDDVLSVPMAQKPLPRMSNATLERVLAKVLARIPAPSGATFLVRRDVLEITTGKAQQAEVWGPNFQGPFLPLVNMTFDNCPLGEALRELGTTMETSIVLDTRVADKARQTVTLRLRNVPLDTAVRLLADQAELQQYLVDNVIYVTSKENAARLKNQDPAVPPSYDDAGYPTGGPRIGSRVPRAQPANP